MNLTHTTSLFCCLLIASTAAAQDPFGGPGQRRGRFRMPPLPVLDALDLDGDGQLSSDELDAAARSLLRLDRNGDGNLETGELMPAPPQDAADGRRRRRPGEPGEAGRPGETRGPDGSGGPGGPPAMGGPGGMMQDLLRRHPVMQALDLDGDGELFLDEIWGAARALDRLDRDDDDVVRADELMPRRGGMAGFGPPGGRGFGGGERGGAPRRYQDVPQPEELDPIDGAATIADLDAFRALSYRGEEVMIDTHLADLEFVKFQIEAADSDAPRLYFMNTKTHRAHPMFMQVIGVGGRGGFGGGAGREGRMRGVLVYRPQLRAPDGSAGLFTFEFEPNDAYPYDAIRIAFDLLRDKAPLLRGRLSYNLLPRARQQWATETERYVEGKLPVFEADDVYGDVAFLPLNEAESYGVLCMLEPGQRPGPRDVVVCRSLPNEMPRTAGVLTSARQTPLSHVNLRCVQDGVPNAFVAGVADDPAVQRLLGRYVHYVVKDDRYVLEEADAAAVEAHFAALRPEHPQPLRRDLDVREIRPLAAIGFGDADAFGVKASNLAAMLGFDLEPGSTPDGYAVPFACYDAFMRHNGLYDEVRDLLADERFVAEVEVRERALRNLRKRIEKAELPDWVAAALAAVQERFPVDTSIRCRSSTNNEDLPGFSGAGLYDSFTHRPDEGHLGKSIRQVYASLWNFRAFEEREFHRVDHLQVAMAVVLHPNQKGERRNGVAVTRDVLYQEHHQGMLLYYVNVQVGEDLVTNPERDSLPEELLLAPRNAKHDRVVQVSSQAGGGGLLSDAMRDRLRTCLREVHRQFAALYGREHDPAFAIECEFKVTAAGALLIKQARPWVD